MKSLVLPAVLAAMVSAGPVSAQDLRLEMRGGLVTIVAQDVSLRQILAEWSRVGQTRIDNADKLVDARITLHLEGVPEKQALDTVLRLASGYIAAPRSLAQAGASMYDRILILATSASVAAPSPAVAATPPPGGFRPGWQRMQQGAEGAVQVVRPVDDYDEEPAGGPPGALYPPGVNPDPRLNMPVPQPYPTPGGGTTVPAPGQEVQQGTPWPSQPVGSSVPGVMSPPPPNPNQPPGQQPPTRPIRPPDER
jgi:hypothetical protein